MPACVQRGPGVGLVGAGKVRRAEAEEECEDIYLHSGATSLSATLVPAGLDISVGIKAARYSKDSSDPQWLEDPELKPFYQWLKEYLPNANPADTFYLSGWTYGQMLVEVLRRCGDDLTRENIMRQATSLKDFRNTALLPAA